MHRHIFLLAANVNLVGGYGVILTGPVVFNYVNQPAVHLLHPVLPSICQHDQHYHPSLNDLYSDTNRRIHDLFPSQRHHNVFRSENRNRQATHYLVVCSLHGYDIVDYMESCL
jgi:hypothetical protein